MARKGSGDRRNKRGGAKAPADEEKVVDLNAKRGRGRPKGSGAKATEAPASDRKVSSKDNGAPVEQATVLRHVGIIAALEEQQRKIVSKIRNARKDAKNDGVPMKSLDRARALLAMTKEEHRIQHNNDVLMMRYLSVPLGAQMSLFDREVEEVSDETTERRAEEEGMIAAKRGLSATDNPHDINGLAGRAWAKGYTAGQAEMRAALEKTTGREKAAEGAIGKPH